MFAKTDGSFEQQKKSTANRSVLSDLNMVSEYFKNLEKKKERSNRRLLFCYCLRTVKIIIFFSQTIY